MSGTMTATDAVGFMVAIMIFSLVIMALSIGNAVFWGLAAYDDAKAKNNNDALMWGLLVGFLGWIPGIIYLCLRNKGINKMIYCPNCQFIHRIVEPNCPNCGIQNQFAMPYLTPMNAEYARKAKRNLIIGIVLCALCVIAVIALVIYFVFFAVQIAEYSGSYSYSYYW